MREYQDCSAQFCKRILDYLDVTFKHQVRIIWGRRVLSGADDQSEIMLSDFRKSGKRGTLAPHTQMGEHLMTYEGLVLYLKEMDEDRYQRLCSVGLFH